MSKKFFIMAFFIAQPSILYGRFWDKDADLVDAEERSNTEAYNDKNSYRFPKRWNVAWQQTEIGYRANAGSLNASRFNYQHDVRFAPRPLDTFTASYTEIRREDLVEQMTEREIRVGWSPLTHRRISLLGDVDTFKEYGDLGVALTLWEDMGAVTEIYAWSVDHYYGSKKSDEAAFRNRDSRTYGFHSYRNVTASDFGWSIRYELDTPLDWTHPAAGYRYEYARDNVDLRVDVPLDPKFNFYGSWSHDHKLEKKFALSTGAGESFFKTMRRTGDVGEVGLDYKSEDARVATLALQVVQRNVDYVNGAKIDANQWWQETSGPSAVRRTEWGLIATDYRPLFKSIAVLNGLMANDVRIREDEVLWHNVEVKYQLLFDFTLNEQTMFAINTTWDIDQVVGDYPYSRRAPFRPWGGGALLIMMKI